MIVPYELKIRKKNKAKVVHFGGTALSEINQVLMLAFTQHP